MRKICFSFLSVQPPDHFVSHCRPFLLESATLPSINTAYLPFNKSFLVYKDCMANPPQTRAQLNSTYPFLGLVLAEASSLFPATSLAVDLHFRALHILHHSNGKSVPINPPGIVALPLWRTASIFSQSAAGWPPPWRL